ncbi:MAG: hypothetical protein ACLSFO_06295, partial [Anaerovoracaceae bacterium]
ICLNKSFLPASLDKIFKFIDACKKTVYNTLNILSLKLSDLLSDLRASRVLGRCSIKPDENQDKIRR